MTQEMIRGLSDLELQQAIVWAADEQNARTAKLKQDTIAKIKLLAAQACVTVSFDGVRGRPKRITKPSSLSKVR